MRFYEIYESSQKHDQSVQFLCIVYDKTEKILCKFAVCSFDGIKTQMKIIMNTITSSSHPTGGKIMQH